MFRWPDGKKAAVSLTFDDARRSQVDTGHAILNAHGIRASFYVLPGGVNERLDGWKAAAAAGHEIANHTMTHPCSGHFAFSRKNALEDYTLDRIAKEITDASDFLKTTLGVTARTFAYPCNDSTVGRGAALHSYVPLIANRFLCGRGGAPFNGPVDPEFVDLARVPIGGSDGVGLAEFTGRANEAVESGGWMVFCGHEIDADGFQTTKAGELEAFCTWLRTRPEIWVDTVAAVAGHIRSVRGT